MSQTLKRVQGIKYVLTHPKQIQWLIIREVKFGKRNQTKAMWVEWQKYDARMHIAMMHADQEAFKQSRESPLSKARIKIFADLFTDLGSGFEVLDVGCGDGVVSQPIVKMGNNVTSVELPGIANIARRCKVPSVVAGDAEQLAFASGRFDVVLASEMLEHLWNPRSFIDEASRVLRSEGWFIVETPEGEGGLCYDSHKNYFTVDKVTRMLGEKFKLCDVRRLKPEVGAQTPTIILLFQKK